jgi:hypothetical protein
LQALFDWSVHDLPVQHVRLFVNGDKSVIVQRSGIIAPVQFNPILPVAVMKSIGIN